MLYSHDIAVTRDGERFLARRKLGGIIRDEPVGRGSSPAEARNALRGAMPPRMKASEARVGLSEGKWVARLIARPEVTGRAETFRGALECLALRIGPGLREETTWVGRRLLLSTDRRRKVAQTLRDRVGIGRRVGGYTVYHHRGRRICVALGHLVVLAGRVTPPQQMLIV